MKRSTRLWRRGNAPRPTPEQVGTARRIREVMDHNAANFTEFRLLMAVFRSGRQPERAYTVTSGKLNWFKVAMETGSQYLFLLPCRRPLPALTA